MNSLALRAILAGLLLATIAVRLWVPQNTSDRDIRATVAEIVARKGWSVQDEAAGLQDALGKAINFRAPECEGQGQIFAIDLSLQLAPMLDSVIRPDYTRRFVYMGRTWFVQDRLGMRLEWLKHRVLSVFGLGRFVSNNTALVIAEPRDCRMAEKVNWSAVWERGTEAVPSNRSL